MGGVLPSEPDDAGHARAEESVLPTSIVKQRIGLVVIAQPVGLDDQPRPIAQLVAHVAVPEQNTRDAPNRHLKGIRLKPRVRRSQANASLKWRLCPDAGLEQSLSASHALALSGHEPTKVEKLLHRDQPEVQCRVEA